MRIRSNESGFGVLGAIMPLVILGAVIYGGVLLWHKYADNGAYGASKRSGTAYDSPAFFVREWGLMADKKSAYTLQYKMGADKQIAYFTADELTAATASAACGIGVVDGVQMAGAGWVVRYDANETTAEYPEMTAQALANAYDSDESLQGEYIRIGTYYYFYIAPQSLCSDKAQDVQRKANKAVKELMGTFKTEY